MAIPGDVHCLLLCRGENKIAQRETDAQAQPPLPNLISPIPLPCQLPPLPLNGCLPHSRHHLLFSPLLTFSPPPSTSSPLPCRELSSRASRTRTSTTRTRLPWEAMGERKEPLSVPHPRPRHQVSLRLQS